MNLKNLITTMNALVEGTHLEVEMRLNFDDERGHSVMATISDDYHRSVHYLKDPRSWGEVMTWVSKQTPRSKKARQKRVDLFKKKARLV